MNKLVFSILFFLCLSSLNAQQNYKRIIGPSPNAGEFDKYGNIPIGTYTGIPNIEIPIYTVLNKGLKLPIFLSYHSSGIQVDEEASRVGLGWVLNCGGAINRQVNGIDDFYPQYGYINNNAPEVYGTDVTQAIKYNQTVTASNGSNGADDCKRAVATQTIDLNGYLSITDQDPKQQELVYDLEPDVFSYNFMGYSGKFMIRKNKEIIQQNQSPLKFELMDGTS